MCWICARRNENPLLWAMPERNPIGKIPLGRPRTRRENVLKKGCGNF